MEPKLHIVTATLLQWNILKYVFLEVQRGTFCLSKSGGLSIGYIRYFYIMTMYAQKIGTDEQAHEYIRLQFYDLRFAKSFFLSFVHEGGEGSVS